MLLANRYRPLERSCFEKWNTISIGSLKRYKADTAITEKISSRDKDRKYELNGTTAALITTT
ncbi:hypothetical protein [Mucilaginibacter sp. SJ]|uniref:hypothetical protein n=1 Tax=Mucilaginibacter sp. SJ TaxID=3029053 RepID=UPI0023A9A727|nr:hypothetical protein [Mucilaginibacter sp. SJ]WEA01610.1 hypothetical protein MusilaSJ_01560 [Mucilaginibacter sp. SJ]